MVAEAWQKLLYIRRKYNKWSVLAILLVALVGIPLFTIVGTLFKGPGSNWKHLAETVLADYVLNSLLLVTGAAAQYPA